MSWTAELQKGQMDCHTVRVLPWIFQSEEAVSVHSKIRSKTGL